MTPQMMRAIGDILERAGDMCRDLGRDITDRSYYAIIGGDKPTAPPSDAEDILDAIDDVVWPVEGGAS